MKRTLPIGSKLDKRLANLIGEVRSNEHDGQTSAVPRRY